MTNGIIVALRLPRGHRADPCDNDFASRSLQCSRERRFLRVVAASYYSALGSGRDLATHSPPCGERVFLRVRVLWSHYRILAGLAEPLEPRQNAPHAIRDRRPRAPLVPDSRCRYGTRVARAARDGV